MNIELTEKDLKIIEFALRESGYRLSELVGDNACQSSPFIAENIKDIDQVYLKVSNKLLGLDEKE